MGNPLVTIQLFAKPADRPYRSFFYANVRDSNDPNTSGLSQSYFDQLVAVVHCQNTVEQKVTSCMQELPYRAILAAIKKMPLIPTGFILQHTFLTLAQ